MLSETELGFTNVKTIDPDIIVDLRYATKDNFTNQIIYDFSTAIARTGTVKKLGIASKLLRVQGYRLKIWDAYRPVSAQEKLFDVYPDPNFVAKPNPNFSHQKGVTFDLTICDLNGKELEMQSKFDDFSERAGRNYERTTQQQRNYDVLNNAMIMAGFIGYSEEWWDYRDSDMDAYTPLAANPNDY
ncbi:M15 family metallopeptidase [Dellaglioa sp. TMW 2.2444]|uniref:D-alanyl-D-alanine dipeptidase n=1 Tax=Dellaglioa carnosa TaxID=2995136 RepID=A0ABT4JPA5_9LACO|nr:M15 family metallopeptidase [Dellaglioa carnosa]MCZ2491811.1 M15 family metallopeptidase [Dellaglioa carnosa]MCZ2494973.1 M15 family metallopeptidase [Dellaglioa carnosa]MDK1731836.1 M15 family metallopeptidase [Dellaglioa carnosa]